MEVAAGSASGKGADMRFLRFLRVIVVVLLVLSAMSTPISAEPRGGAAVAGEGGWLQGLWGFLAGLLSDAGCGIDPLGGCRQEAPSSDAGCTLDPLGGCQQAVPTVDEGCTIDPLGRCATSR